MRPRDPCGTVPRHGDAVDIGGFRLVGAGLATLMVALSKRYGMSRARIQEFHVYSLYLRFLLPFLLLIKPLT